MKNIFILAVVAFAGCVARGDLLYWQVNASDVPDAIVSDYQYATISAVDTSSGKTTLLSYAFPGDTGMTYVDKSEFVDGTGSTGMYADLSTLPSYATAPADYSMLIELYDAQKNLIGASSEMAYSTWQSYVSASEFSSNWTSMSSKTGFGATSGTNSYSAVPEPTSGLLMLLGAAMLGLRRRKVA